MAEYKRPIPVPDEASRPFFEGANRHELMLQRCTICGAYLYPVKLRCDLCLNTSIEWVEASGKGRLYSFGLMHQLYDPRFADEIPYNVALVELEEGIRIVSNVVGCPSSELRIDMPLQVTFEDINDEVAIPKFKPVT